LQSLAQALNQTSQQLQQQGQQSVAQYTTKAADQVEHLAHYLHQRDLNQLIGEAQDYARQHLEPSRLALPLPAS
jgi:glutamate synthase domain-containing protein 2